MKLFLYNTSSANNVINKELTDELELNVVFKGVADFISPTVELISKTILNHNYAYIPDLNRYYFINDRESFPNKKYTLKLECDVLMTYKDDILNSTATVSRTPQSNKYFDGGDYRSEVKNEHKLYQSDKTLEFEESTVLVTIGG